MLIRFVVNNLYSFGHEVEFNMMPNSRLRTLEHHKYRQNGINLLKMASIYGANGAGKSNLIFALYLMQMMVLREGVPKRITDNTFKLNSTAENLQTLAIEFIQDETAFYYGIEISGNVIVTEELYESGLGEKPDLLIFERKTDKNDMTSINFLPAFEDDTEGALLKGILLEEFVKPNKPILKLIANRNNKHLNSAKNAFKWFADTLQVVTPEAKPIALANRISNDEFFKSYAEEMLCALDVGICSLHSETKKLSELLGEENSDLLEQITQKLEDNPEGLFSFRHSRDEEIVAAKENGELVGKRLQIGHKGSNDELVLFDLKNESDGTKRLLDYVPAFQDVITAGRVYVVDEIERSIHPLLIKELIKHFSQNTQTNGQLIFSTHESNLLDQELFRQDEIWFVEKNRDGATELYPLSDYKEHKTIDIRKGYLNGRYGSIPFLANIQDLNWNKNDFDKSDI